MDPASEPSIRASVAGALVLATLVGAVVAGATFAGDGSDVGGTLPVGGAAVVLLAGLLVAIGLGWLPPPQVGRSGAALVCALVLLVAWTGVTVWWSIVGDRSWDAFNKTVAYAAFLGLGIVLAASTSSVGNTRRRRGLVRESSRRGVGVMSLPTWSEPMVWGE